MIKHYLIIDYSGLDDSIQFDILSTEHKRGTEKFAELIESYETNVNCVLVKEIDLSTYLKLNKLINKIEELEIK